MYEKPSVGIKPFEFVPESLTGEELLNFALLFIPSFTDANAVWRLAYWGFGLKSIFIENFGIFGNGFGVEYVNEDNIQALSLLFQSANDLNIYEERFLRTTDTVNIIF